MSLDTSPYLCILLSIGYPLLVSARQAAMDADTWLMIEMLAVVIIAECLTTWPESRRTITETTD